MIRRRWRRALVVAACVPAAARRRARESPPEDLDRCTEMVFAFNENWILNRGETHSLSGKLERAASSLGDENTGAAANKLHAFLHEVRAFQASGRINS